MTFQIIIRGNSKGHIQRKMSYADMKTLSCSELKSKYKMDDRQLEQQVRHECYGAHRDEIASFYGEVYKKKGIAK